MEKITGKNNTLVKDIKKLLTSSKHRAEQHMFVLEGARLVFDVLNSFYKVEYFLITESAYEKYSAQSSKMTELASKSYIISNDVADKLSETKNSQGVFAVCRMLQSEFETVKNGRYIVLDNVQDPGNLGTIIRTAEALGISGIVICGGCDIYNPKVLRSSMGSMLRINVKQSDNALDVVNDFIKQEFAVWATSPDSSLNSITDIDFSNGGVCVIGNEANGVSDEVMEKCTGKITIPMAGRAESLNASVAASITMWEMLR